MVAPDVTIRRPDQPIQLRGYQIEAVEAVEAAFQRGVHRPLVNMPTGAGKTVVLAEIVRRRPGRALVIAHRDELLDQAAAKIRMINPGADVGIVKAAQDDVGAQVVVASVQTLACRKRLDRLGSDFATVIIDEAHHSVAPTYRRVLEHCAGSDSLVLGVTATPDRGDGVGLDRVFDEIVFSLTMPEMICRGYLADLRAVQIRFDLDLSSVAVRCGDYVAADAGRALLRAHGPQIVAQAYRKYAEGRRGIIFTPTVTVARQMAAALTEVGVRAESLDGTTSPDFRRGILGRLRSGETEVVTNCAVLTEGFDEPAVDCIVIARPTMSSSLYCQMIGRGTRRSPGKLDCLVLDIVGIASRLDVVTLASLAGVDSEELAVKPVTELLAAMRSQPMAPGSWSGDLAAFEVNLFRRRPMAWVHVADRWIISTGRGSVTLEPVGSRWQVIHQQGCTAPVLVASGLTVEYALGVGEDVIRKVGAAPLARNDARWRARPATASQLSTLLASGSFVPTGITSGEASNLITAGRLGS